MRKSDPLTISIMTHKESQAQLEWMWRDSHGLSARDVDGLAREELGRIINHLVL